MLVSFCKSAGLAGLLAALLVFAGAASAQEYYASSAAISLDPVPGAEPVAQLPLCVQLTVTIGTASGGATVSGSTGVFSVSFGNVNGLGIGTPASGVSVSKSASGATYTTPIVITATFTGCLPLSTTKTLTIYQDATTSSKSQSAAREGSSAASVVTVPTSLASATIVTSSPTSGAAITRYVGVFVSNANGGSAVTGTLAPKFIYNLKVQ